MIFDTNYSRYNDNTSISPYELNMEGALLHIYETELNYNNIMKAVAISELRYYQDTGKDLFVNEAGAFRRFIDAIIKFFRDIINRIKEIFNKFIATIKKKLYSKKVTAQIEDEYKKDAYNKKVDTNKPITFTGYTFEGLNVLIMSDTLCAMIHFLDYEMMPTLDNIAGSNFGGDDEFDNHIRMSYEDKLPKTEEKINELLSKFRKRLTNNNDDNIEYTEEVFKEKLHEKCYGEKIEYDDINPYLVTRHIKNADRDISVLEKQRNVIIKNFETLIKALEKADKTYESEEYTSESDKKQQHEMVLQYINMYKIMSQDTLIAFNTILGAVKDRLTQSQSMLQFFNYYKKDQSFNTESTIYNNIFSNVNII